MKSDMRSSINKRSVVVGGHKTSVSLEDAFWKALKEIASSRQITVADLVAGMTEADDSPDTVVAHCRMHQLIAKKPAN